MKPGTKFKLQCEVGYSGSIFTTSIKGGKLQLHRQSFGGETNELLYSDFLDVSDIVTPSEPRKRFTDVDGRIYEVLRPDDIVEKEDIYHDHNGTRNRALNINMPASEAMTIGNNLRGYYLRPVKD
jgi:hypothetical protein